MAKRGTKAVAPLYSHWEKKEAKELAAILLDFKRWCAEAKIVINKDGHAVPFILNEAQEQVAGLILPYVFAQVPEPVSLVIQKSRQMGISVLLSAIEQYITARKRNLNALHIMPSEELAKEFFNTKWLPLLEGTHPQFLPDCFAAQNPTPYIKIGDFLGHTMNCNVHIAGSESRAAGRSGTNHVVIFDEYAFYNNVTNLQRGVLATMPKTGMTLTVYVSTANGNNWFYDEVQKAKAPGSRIAHLFLPWHMLKEYEREPDENSRFYDLDTYTPTEYDMKLMDIFEKRGYPEESWIRKLEFYDHTLAIEGKGDQDYMFENYPSDDEESFSVTGRPVLPAKVINYWLDQPHKTIYVDQFMQNVKGREQIVIAPTERSAIRQFKEPQAGHRYILSIDPSSGYAADRSAGVILDLNTMEEVCFFSDFIEQTDLADLAVNLAKYYNRAQILIERNMGEVCIEFIQQLNYPRLWIDLKNTTSKTVKFGVRTTVPLKNENIRRFRFLLQQGIYKPHDTAFLKEAQHFNWVPMPSGSGFKAEATGTDDDGQPWHDDTVMARVILMSAIDMSKFKNYMSIERRNTANKVQPKAYN